MLFFEPPKTGTHLRVIFEGGVKKCWAYQMDDLKSCISHLPWEAGKLQGLSQVPFSENRAVNYPSDDLLHHQYHQELSKLDCGISLPNQLMRPSQRLREDQAWLIDYYNHCHPHHISIKHNYNMPPQTNLWIMPAISKILRPTLCSGREKSTYAISLGSKQCFLFLRLSHPDCFEGLDGGVFWKCSVLSILWLHGILHSCSTIIFDSFSTSAFIPERTKVFHPRTEVREIDDEISSELERFFSLARAFMDLHPLQMTIAKVKSRLLTSSVVLVLLRRAIKSLLSLDIQKCDNGAVIHH